MEQPQAEAPPTVDVSVEVRISSRGVTLPHEEAQDWVERNVVTALDSMDEGIDWTIVDKNADDS